MALPEPEPELTPAPQPVPRRMLVSGLLTTGVLAAGLTIGALAL